MNKINALNTADKNILLKLIRAGETAQSPKQTFCKQAENQINIQISLLSFI